MHSIIILWKSFINEINNHFYPHALWVIGERVNASGFMFFEKDILLNFLCWSSSFSIRVFDLALPQNISSKRKTNILQEISFSLNIYLKVKYFLAFITLFWRLLASAFTALMCCFGFIKIKRTGNDLLYYVLFLFKQ